MSSLIPAIMLSWRAMGIVATIPAPGESEWLNPEHAYRLAYEARLTTRPLHTTQYLL